MRGDENLPARLKILMTPFSGNEKYIDTCVRILSHFWPDHPELIVCSDRGAFEYDNKVVAPLKDWTSLTAAVLTELLDAVRLSPEDQLILLLEDHIPHARIDGAALLQLASYLRANGNTYMNLGGHGQAQRIGEAGGCAV